MGVSIRAAQPTSRTAKYSNHLNHHDSGEPSVSQLSTGLRVGSAISIVAYAVAAALILRRTGFRAPWLSRAVARIGSWVLVVLLTLGTLANFLSQSPWVRFLLGPVTFVLAALCFVVARSTADTVGSASERPERQQATH